ncbi:alpha/beta hydrolase [Streptomyces sp. NBC_01565]|uniref:alpha/beta fold hydrolase n=1 Tax=unclassified Streptomyces TaxID=2593676 RepID=UPI002258D64E|nr:alpha/beta hydrolase [Streptomyces sp. NBC_01565]MCX4545600.1 alpha/beta hydrolase [Streptomyces sp. NBC_01565]
MPTFAAPDGTLLAYRVTGDNDAHADATPVICLPGGPTDSRYLGDLGGLSAHRRLATLDPRGTGRSAAADPASYRCDRLVDDVEALRRHLGPDRIDLLAHCAGANVAVRYAARHPERVGRLALITPSVRAVGIPITADDRRETALLRKDEPWFPPAFAALEAVLAGEFGAGHRRALAPFSHGRWDEATRLRHAAEEERLDAEVVAAFGAEGAFDPEGTRAALARFARPVLVLAGEVDPGAPPRVLAEFAGLFPDARLVVQPRAGHTPWHDDADRFVTAVAGFLG